MDVSDAPLGDLPLVETRQAFDAVAKTYHRSNVDNAILAAMRERLRQTVRRYVRAGSDLLDLGCGPGTDTEYFAANTYCTTAIDWSPAMVAEARQRLAAAGLQACVDVRHLGIDDVHRLAPKTFDAVCSDLGPLNCVANLEQAAGRIADRIRPGGFLIASVIGRLCPWEIALYASRGDWRRLRVRFARARVPVPLEGRTVWVRYYAPRAFERPFRAAGLRPVERRALGVFLPPPYLNAFAARHPTLIHRLERMEDAMARWPVVRSCGDHFLIVMQKN